MGGGTTLHQQVPCSSREAVPSAYRALVVGWRATTAPDWKPIFRYLAMDVLSRCCPQIWYKIYMPQNGIMDHNGNCKYSQMFFRIKIHIDLNFATLNGDGLRYEKFMIITSVSADWSPGSSTKSGRFTLSCAMPPSLLYQLTMVKNWPPLHSDKP